MCAAPRAPSRPLPPPQPLAPQGRCRQAGLPPDAAAAVPAWQQRAGPPPPQAASSGWAAAGAAAAALPWRLQACCHWVAPLPPKLPLQRLLPCLPAPQAAPGQQHAAAAQSVAAGSRLVPSLLLPPLLPPLLLLPLPAAVPVLGAAPERVPKRRGLLALTPHHPRPPAPPLYCCKPAPHGHRRPVLLLLLLPAAPAFAPQLPASATQLWDCGKSRRRPRQGRRSRRQSAARQSN